MAQLSTVFLDWSVDGDVDTAQPRVTAAAPLTSAAVEVSFNEQMLNNAALNDPANYAIDDPRIIVISAAPFGDFKVRLVVSEMLDAQPYVVTVVNIEDREGNLIDPAANTASFLGAGSTPELASAEAVDPRKIRLIFSEPMRRDGDLLNVFNYAVIPLATGSPVNVGSITTESQTNPTFVDLDVTEMTDGQSYQAIVVNVNDAAGNVIGANNTFNFTGEGAAPVILRLEAISENRVDVVFDEPILDNAFARDKLNYVWTGGLTTESVLDVSGDRIKLVTSDQASGVLYDLVVG